MTRRVLRRKYPERITHKQVVKVAQRLIGYGWICRFFTLQVEDSATKVNGECADDYELSVGLAIVKHFVDRWNGCPEEACRT